LGKFSILLLIISGFATSVFAQTITIRGKVVDEKNEPIPFAIVNLNNNQRYAYTDSIGDFIFSIPSKSQSKYWEFKVSYVGKRTIETKIPFENLVSQLIFRMQELSLTLKDVEVNQVRKTQNSNSSIVFDRQALEQTQAFSLTDVLNNLPGEKIGCSRSTESTKHYIT